MEFEAGADFDFLKSLVVDAARDADVDIFDNIFDWSLILTS